MLQVSLPGLVDIWDHPPSDEDSPDLLVLGGISDDHGQARRVRPTSAVSIGPDLLRDRMDDAAQTPPGDGERG